MNDLDQLLAAIRFGDSAFPSGGFAFSSGLEGSHRDGLVQDEHDVSAFLAEQLEGNWHRRDRVLLRRAWAAPDPSAVDLFADAVTTMSVLREASRRAGAATLATFAAVIDPGLADYRRLVLAGTVPGHLAVVQAICLRAAGLSLETAEAVAGWQVISGIASAAVRLDICGHLGAQRVVAAASPLLVELLRRRPPEEPAGFTAYADVAAQRHREGVRLFAS
ncbi:urease accessory protein [Mycolicibacterium sp. BK634]|uniref:urease accessory protein UreF n=1 Tax=Mycobacteriaceae TaxID=1762 RepID=UPI00105CF1D1|nr:MULTISPECIES: urease accessory UreF family protein [Mycobacteriaceae]MBB3749087.1 urease accessory protein [Mycolicibacterium sp. BK634]TDO14703.1 urease accessory protein [Mycobacterium sp. BK086]